MNRWSNGKGKVGLTLHGAFWCDPNSASQFCCWKHRLTHTHRRSALPETCHGPPTIKETHPGLSHMASFYLHMLISCLGVVMRGSRTKIKAMLLFGEVFIWHYVCFLTSRRSEASRKDQLFPSAVFTLRSACFSPNLCKLGFAPHRVNVTRLTTTQKHHSRAQRYNSERVPQKQN